jgi:hypothetical protein
MRGFRSDDGRSPFFDDQQLTFLEKAERGLGYSASAA